MSEQERVNFVATNHDAAGGTLVAHIQDLSSHPRLFISKSTLSGGGGQTARLNLGSSLPGIPVGRSYQVRTLPGVPGPVRVPLGLDTAWRQSGGYAGSAPVQFRAGGTCGNFAKTKNWLTACKNVWAMSAKFGLSKVAARATIPKRD